MPAAVRRAALVATVLLGPLACLLGLLPGAAAAHQPRPTLVTVSTAGDATHPALDLVAELPLDKLRLAYGVRITDDPARAVRDQADLIADLVAARVGLHSTDGDWSVEVVGVRPSAVEGRDTARVELRATPPPGRSPADVDLRWEVITDVVFTHKVYVGGIGTDGTERLVGLVTAQTPSVPLTVDAPAATPVESMFAVGWGHFREGLDHQLFLCLLVLAALRRRATVATTLRRLVGLTVAFTVGHSLSLALAASGLVTLPSRWVETAIAVTILLAALHAVRQVLTVRHELAVTALFGLVHGFGFAGTLADLSLHGRALVVPVLTFNLGLEVAQVLALALFAVPLWVIARSGTASTLTSALVGVVAAGWIVQRALDVPDPIDALLATWISGPERLAALLVVGGVVLALSRAGAGRRQVRAPRLAA